MSMQLSTFKTLLDIVAVTTENFYEIHSNGNSEKRQHFY